MDIYFKDFNEETQKEILKLYNISDPSEMNWDTIPITTITEPNGDDDDDDDFDLDYDFESDLTPEEKKEADSLYEQICNAREICIADMKSSGIDYENWIRKGKEVARGTIKCPVCNKDLAYGVYQINGHIHARCSTENCLMWWE